MTSKSKHRFRLPRLSITSAIVGGASALLLLVVGLMVATGYGIARRSTNELIAQKSDLIIDSIVARTRAHLEPVAHQLDFLGQAIEAGRIDPSDEAALNRAMAASMAGNRQVSVVAFVDPNLIVRRAFRNRPARPFARNDWSDDRTLRRMIGRARGSRQPFWGELFVAEAAGSTLINHVRPVRVGGTYRGTLIAGVSIRRLSRFVRRLGRAHGSQAFILRGAGGVIAHPSLGRRVSGLSDRQPLPRLDQIGDPVLSAPRTIALLRTATSQSPRRTEDLIVDGKRYVMLIRRVRGYGTEPWLVGAYLPAADVTAEVSRLSWVPIIGLAIALLALIGAGLLGRLLSQPIRRLAAEARKVRRLDFDKVEKLPRGRFREHDQVFRAFNTMIAGLRAFSVYVPKTLVHRVVREGAPHEARTDERIITIMFTDIVGFTALSEKFDAAAIAHLLNSHFGLVDACVEAEGGTVDKYIGDSVMAFWGAPQHQDDHAARACRCALRIAEQLKADNKRRRAEGQVTVRVRIGIYTGPVVVGDIGSPRRINYTVIGDTVNTAQRIEVLARELAGARVEAATLIGRETADRLDGSFKLKPMGPHRLRGRRRPIEVFRLMG